MRNIRIISGFLLLTTFACKKTDNQDTISKEIKKEIKEFKKNDFVCDNAKIIEFDYGNYKLYEFNPGMCVDGMVNILDENGETICSIGGIGGLKCDDPLYSGTLNSERVIWSE